MKSNIKTKGKPNSPKRDKAISKKLSKIVGSVTLPPNFDEKKELEAYYRSKYMQNP